MENHTAKHNEHFVSLDIVNEYALRNSINTKGISSYSIEAIVDNDADTLMYIINYPDGEGWEIVSADMRTPATIAKSDFGSFSLENTSPALSLWLDDTKATMSQILQSEDCDLNFSEFELESNLSTWESYSSNQINPPINPGDGGEWYSQTTVHVIIDSTVTHLVAKWDQKSPYNEYCPYKTDGSGGRAPAGCVAIAGSQILYFLHEKIGVPSQIVSAGYCYGDINNYSRGFSIPSSAIWSDMSKEYNVSGATAEALLIGHVGDMVNMHYRNNYSWSLPGNIKDDLLPAYGISCERDDYDEDIVKQSLLSGFPVIVSASDMLVPIDFDIHCFVIDGYQLTHNEYVTHHYWVPDDPRMDFDPNHPSYDTYSYSTKDITSVQINWGWWTQWYGEHLLNDGWYSLTGDWLTVHSGGGSETWDHNRVMLYGFTTND